eukprot:Phypoly_transcript_14851.p1 GENE.Phypoly_transcript_14851~~Phypoly_transcript_14851.p1  ORF type:complete len:320 (+),score=47.93 Phypoly_transcript_14851:144-962(+)
MNSEISHLKSTSPSNSVGANTNNSVITINVGGTIFTTSHTTLQHAEYFVAMFNGSFKAASMVNGNYFLDRDPRLFGIILSFLRSRNFPNLATRHEKKEVMEEARFYGVEALATYLEYNLLDIGVTVHASKESLLVYWKIPEFSKHVYAKTKEQQINYDGEPSGELAHKFVFRGLDVHIFLVISELLQYQLFYTINVMEIQDLITIISLIDQNNPANSVTKSDSEIYWQMPNLYDLVSTEELLDPSKGFIVDDNLVLRIEFKDVPDGQRKHVY